MSDNVMRGLRVQLTTTMDMVLRTALFEIVKVFENALHDHRMEVAQKGEEIAQLKVKLQTAEIKLKDFELGRSGGAEANPSRRKPEVPDARGQSSSLPEIEFEVPDDWCAPLGDETVTKPKNALPGVRLRQFSIPLWQVPIKNEMLKYHVNIQRSKSIRRSRRISSLNDKSKHTVIKKVPYCEQGGKPPAQRGDIRILLEDLKHENCDLTNISRLRRSNRGKKNVQTHQERLENQTKNWSKSAGLQDTKTSVAAKYPCRFCNKLFQKQSGRNNHARIHRTCRGCKKVLASVDSISCHVQTCAKFKKRMAREAKKRREKDSAGPLRTQLTVKEESVELSVNGRERVTRKRLKPSRQGGTSFTDASGDPGWMRPLEDVEEN
ncbi:uncharacterized protein LOC108243048 [Kryptolebias marmoratus]|uniref:uncharacterized protein LOC108243048 n=1 Tax=Kryptolebias marmoratus TaxID=37003 RepID=UPI0007F8DD9A|nr:uncharacterized protein LOC108243048 [Kryptolebias marmoratus]XP_017283723.1 uncharacterized protein LOC108243048 [Kryptolebias marmoratus]XP_017283724.1 uncharacterized protein LOC108243048 [Kryptolebias marmoratus]XP_037833354.1 uncharacterized protein LOC108243048 [Kryptolebias marmoratus]XP_037833355.1 uncharacterized protein LOC108243048 [Kryptolebias marmoratus]